LYSSIFGVVVLQNGLNSIEIVVTVALLVAVAVAVACGLAAAVVRSEELWR
jgi:hypothetical protein